MEPVAGAKDHRHAALPAATSLRYVVWRNNSFGLHVHVAIQGADRAVKVSDGLRAYLPELLAWSASSPFVENVNTGLHSARTQIFTRFFPRCGVPDAYGDWDTFADYVEMLYAPGSIGDPTEMWWSVRPHLGFPTVEIRISDAQPLQEVDRAGGALVFAGGEDRPRRGRGRAVAPAGEPRDRGELLARSAGASPGTSSTCARTRCGPPGRPSRSCSSGCSPSPSSSAPPST